MKDLSKFLLAVKILQEQLPMTLFPFMLSFHPTKINWAYKKLRPDMHAIKW